MKEKTEKERSKTKVEVRREDRILSASISSFEIAINSFLGSCIPDIEVKEKILMQGGGEQKLRVK